MNTKMTAKILGFIALGLTVAPPILYATLSLPEAVMKNLMLIGCVLWFVTAPIFMKGGAE